MIVGIISKEDHAKSHAKGLIEDGHSVVLLGADGERIPENLEVMVCRIGSCSHRGSSVAREWKRTTGRPLIVEDGLAGIRRQLKLLTNPTPVSIPTPTPAPVRVGVAPHAQPESVRVPTPAPDLPRPPEEPVKPTPVLLSPPPPPPPPSTARHISRGPYAEWTRAKRVAVLTQIFRKNPEMNGSDAWKLHEAETSPRSMDREMVADARRAARGESPRIATVPTSEVPAGVLAATPANLQRTKAAPTDVKELVQLLRVAMEAEGIEKLVVTKDTVSFRRVVVEEGTFDV